MRRIRPTNGCHNCARARWERTEKGNIRRNVPGRCQYPVTKVDLLKVLDDFLPASRHIVGGLALSTGIIWPDMGGNCSKWRKV